MIELKAAMLRAKLSSSRVVSRLKDQDGRQGDRSHSIPVRVAESTINWPTSPHTPAPASARPTATMPDTNVAVLSIQKRARKLIDLLSSAFCTTPADPSRNVDARAAVSKVRRGSW